MGYEAKCRVRVDDRSGTIRAADGIALLETDELIVRGDARVRVPRSTIANVTSRAGVVTVTSPTAIVSLTLGPEASECDIVFLGVESNAQMALTYTKVARV